MFYNLNPIVVVMQRVQYKKKRVKIVIVTKFQVAAADTLCVS